jgi:hypothetical protein
MGPRDAHLRVDPDMELGEFMGAAASRPQIVNAASFRMAGGDRDKAASAFLGPFLVHQLVDGMGRGAPGTDQQPDGNDQTEDRVGADKTGILVDTSARMTDGLSRRSL